MTNPVQAIGKMLSVPVKRGQSLSRRNLVPEGTGKELAVRAIENGMRAVSISLMDYAALQGLLYPGSLVDVMASFRGTSNSGTRRDAFSLTLLQGVQVLAVEDQTVVSSPKEKEEGAKGGRESRAGSKKFLVTLKVDPEEAQALQLAMQYGVLSLSLRNPLDRTPVGRPRIQLRDLGLFGLQLAMAEPEEEKDREKAEAGGGTEPPASPGPPEKPGPEAPSTRFPSMPSTQLSSGPSTQPGPSPLKLLQPVLEPVVPVAPGEAGAYAQETWKMTIIRGTTTSEVSFPGPESAEDSTVPQRSTRREAP